MYALAGLERRSLAENAVSQVGYTAGALVPAARQRRADRQGVVAVAVS
jgi:hypothetical protein